MTHLLRPYAIRIIRFFQIMGPILLSASSIFLTFCVLQPLALSLDPSFTLLANRSVGKIAFTLIVLLHIFLLTATTSQKFFRSILEHNFKFLLRTAWIKPYLGFFISFAAIHALILVILCATTPYLGFDPSVLSLVPYKLQSLALGFIATFFLAWTEEAIFRGTLYPFLAQTLSPLVSMLITSLIFMLAHDLSCPLNLVTVNWKLGLGLFLLGFFLNLLYNITQMLAVGMGAHAGLVFIKVFLRRIPCITYAAALPWWLDVDLRQSFVVHVLLLAAIMVILAKFYKNHNHALRT